MKKLFADDFVTEKGFPSTEDYIRHSLENNVDWISFPNVDYYNSLFDSGFLKIGDAIRTSNQGIIDECYCVIARGNLKGITNIATHQGMKGTFAPEKILIGERISDGWSVYRKVFEREVYKRNR